MNDIFSFEFIKNALLIPFIWFLIPIFWDLWKTVSYYIKEFIMRQHFLLIINIDLPPELSNRKDIKFKFLVVRFWTDAYIKDMASDSEKFIWRLRNKVIEWEFENWVIKYNIPLHKRLWTQFKCFAEFPTEKEAKVFFYAVEKYESIDASLSCSEKKNRVFLLLKNYWITDTIDWFKNNIIMPL